MRGPCCAVVVLTAVVALTAAGCTSAGTNASESTTTEPVAPVTSATTDAVTTTVPATTVPPTTTPTTTSTTTTTTTSTTEPAPSLDELEAEVAAAYDERYEGYWACLRAPLACDTSWLMDGGASSETMQDTMQALADRDRYVGDDPVGYYVIESIEFNDDLTEATVTACWWSTAVLYTTPIDPNQPPGPDNPPTIVNNTPGSGFQADVLVLVNDRWLLSSAQLLDDGSRTDICGGET